MLYPRMPFANSSFVALLLVSYVTGITSTVDDYAEQAACSLADVAHTHRFDLAIHSRIPEWYSDGMHLFAFKHNEHIWHKREIGWAIEQHSTHVPQDFAERVFREAFEKWSERIPKDFKQTLTKMEFKAECLLKGLTRAEWDPGNISIWFKKDPTKDDPSYTDFRAPRLKAFDTFGVDIIINDNLNWTDESRTNYNNLRFAALHEIGHVLGLANSDKAQVVMSGARKRYKKKGEPTLESDDIDGVQSLYGARDGGPSRS